MQARDKMTMSSLPISLPPGDGGQYEMKITKMIAVISSISIIIMKKSPSTMQRRRSTPVFAETGSHRRSACALMRPKLGLKCCFCAWFHLLQPSQPSVWVCF
jgi:hypothetical protein